MPLEPESSLPARPPSAPRSSPPVQVADVDSLFDEMENAAPVKPEPAETAAEPQAPRAPSSADTERPPSGQQPKEDEHNDESDDEIDNTDPGDKIQPKDWEELEHRYHEMIKKCQGQEEQLAREFDSLMAVLPPSLPAISDSDNSSSSRFGQRQVLSRRQIGHTLG